MSCGNRRENRSFTRCHPALAQDEPGIVRSLVVILRLRRIGGESLINCADPAPAVQDDSARQNT